MRGDEGRWEVTRSPGCRSGSGIRALRTGQRRRSASEGGPGRTGCAPDGGFTSRTVRTAPIVSAPAPRGLTPGHQEPLRPHRCPRSSRGSRGTSCASSAPRGRSCPRPHQRRGNTGLPASRPRGPGAARPPPPPALFPQAEMAQTRGACFQPTTSFPLGLRDQQHGFVPQLPPPAA